LKEFAEWLSTTAPSVFIQTHEVWMIPTIQSFHIIGISLAVGSALMITLRILGWAGADETLLQTQRRFGPWLNGALCLLLASGALLVVGEPVRELVTFSFWLKMSLVLLMTVIALGFQVGVNRRPQLWDGALVNLTSVKWAALLIFLIWGCIIILGRLIAYDHIWGHLSPATKA
jgi:uncharacterized membrane protein SirB2